MKELSSRLRKSGDDSFGERKARDELAEATSAEVERLKLAEAKRVKLDLREDCRFTSWMWTVHFYMRTWMKMSI